MNFAVPSGTNVKKRLFGARKKYTIAIETKKKIIGPNIHQKEDIASRKSKARKLYAISAIVGISGTNARTITTESKIHPRFIYLSLLIQL